MPVSDLIADLEAMALRHAPQREVYVRAACIDGCVYVDLGDPRWRAIEIGPTGWQVVVNPPARFVRAPGTLPLPMPEHGGSIANVRSLFDTVGEEEFVLIVHWLVTAFVRDHQKPVLIFRGGEGTAKTTLMRVLQALIDPRCAPPLGVPSSESKLLSAARSTYLVPLDNVCGLTPRMSDALCRLVTGGSNQPLIINGIADVVSKPDLADRSIFLDLAPITDARRRTQRDVTAEFAKMGPHVLGVILDILALGLRNLPQTKPARLPRMADFAKLAIACETAWWPAGTFEAAYDANRADAVEALLEADPVGTAARSFVASRKSWTGTATELDGMLRAMSGNLTGVIDWPAEPRILASRLKALATSLLKVGVEVNFDRARDRAVNGIEPAVNPADQVAVGDVANEQI
jgi:hypothetical protein